MRFQTPLVPGRLIKRYKRFLSDIQLDNGEEVVAHCPNPGAMLGLKDPGIRVWLEPNDDPRKKLKYGWRLIEFDDGSWVGIDTGVPNRVVKDALIAQEIPALAAYGAVRPEVKYGEKSRVDFLLTEPGLPDAYVEVKNAHLKRTDDLAEFPDSVTTRGARHLRELSEMVAQGHRAILLFVVQRTDCTQLKIADDLDPAYGQAFKQARAAGVEIMAVGCNISQEAVTLADPVAVIDIAAS